MYQDVEFEDDVRGGTLDKEMMIKARRAEMQFFKKLGVYKKVRKESHMKVITTKWVDTNKGDEKDPNYRARWVGRELALSKRTDLFAATPPLESLRMLLSIVAGRQSQKHQKDNFILMTNDVKRAYFYAPATRPIYIKIPEEDREPGDEENVGMLRLSLYGTRDAAMNWAKTYTFHLKGLGFIVGSSNPCNFYHPQRDVACTVHGDDYTSAGRERI